MLALTAVIATTGLAQRPSGDLTSTVLTGWIDLHCQLVRKTTGIPHVAYSRHFSYTAIAVYESIVASYPANRSLVKQLNDLPALPATPKGKRNQELCVNAAYAEMTRAFYSSFNGCRASIDSMEKAQIERIGQHIINGETAGKSILFGKAIAAHILKWANADGSAKHKEYVPLKGEGLWTTATAAAASFWYENRSITPAIFSVFAMTAPVYSKDTASAFFKMANEVYQVGKNLSEEQRTIALYWDDSPNGKYMTAFGHWASILSALIKQRSLSLIKAAEAFVKMTIVLHDASILVWKGKYQYNVQRPVSYIQQQIDHGWQPLITTPPHPEFPAAHATLSYAAAMALQTLFGDNCPVTDKTYTDIGMTERNYHSLQEVAREAGLSRLYGGIHYRYSIEQGFTIGETIARFIDSSVSFHFTK